MLSKLTKLAEEFNVAVLYTNQVMSNPDGGMSFVPDPKKAVGGLMARDSSYACNEHGGRGWAATVVSATNVSAVVKFTSATDKNCFRKRTRSGKFQQSRMYQTFVVHEFIKLRALCFAISD